MEQVRERILKAQPDRSNPLASPAANGTLERRLAILKDCSSGSLSEIVWQLGAPPAEKTSVETADGIEARKQFGSQARILSPTAPGVGKERKSYFASLPDQLQTVLRAQLRQSGDVSAVIETPSGFLLYVAKQKTDDVLSVAEWSLPKRGYDLWLQLNGKN